MRKIYRRIFLSLLSFAVALNIGVVGVVSAAPIAKADNSNTPFENTYVLDDLKNSVIEGKNFNLDDYTNTETKDINLITLLEYYPTSPTVSNYKLFVYVHNPSRLNIDTDSSLNMISLNLGFHERYYKFPLRFINCSTDNGCEQLFYKFAVDFDNDYKEVILKNFTYKSRSYQVSGIEIHESGKPNAVDYSVAKKFTYSGYTPTSSDDNSSKLTCEVEEFDFLQLEVHPTIYRPDGVKGMTGRNYYTQESLHSVYFAVPNSTISEYGKMSQIHATWLNAILQPTVITSNIAAYTTVKPWLGQTIPAGYEGASIDHCFIGDYACLSAHRTNGGYAYNYPIKNLEGPYVKQISKLNMIILNNSGINTWNYVLPSEKLIEEMKAAADSFPIDPLICGKYPKSIFQKVDNKFTDVVINATDEYSLTSKKIDINFWRLLFTGTLVDTTIYDGIQAIYPVKSSDFSGTQKEVCERLYISQGDYYNFIEFYNTYASTHTVYLFRYQVSDYVSMKATSLERAGWLVERWDYPKKDSYIFEQTVNLEFDIIDVTFTKGLDKTIIPVVSSPIDVVPSPTPPPNQMDESINLFEPYIPDADDGGCAKLLAALPSVFFAILVVFIIRFFVKRSKKKKEKEDEKKTE